MKRVLILFLAGFVVFSCSSKRPQGEGEYNYSLTVNSIQADAGVELLDGKTVVKAGTTDEKGVTVFDDVRAVAALTVKVCGGTVNLVSSEEPVAWTGCTYSSFKPEDRSEITVTVDFLSTFILNYETETTVEEWKEYLDMTTLPAPSLQTSLTDATKRYLWQQGIAKIAENVSKANGVTPESMYSTENLLNLLVADLLDDKIINGSTGAKFGSLEIGSIVLKSVLADAIPAVSNTFSASDLKSWTDKIRYSDAKFLEGTGSGIDSDKPVITILEPVDGSIVFGEVEVLATATDNIKVTSLNCRITGEDMPELVDTDNEPDSFHASFDSTEIPDGQITINCIASDGTSLTEKSVKVTVSNSNEVKLSAFITGELYEWDNVSVYDSENKRVVNTAFDEDEVTKIFLAPGSYRFTFKGGYYEPVFLDEEEIKFDSTLETRGVVKAGEVTEIVATPLTTIREYLYRALAEKGDAQAEKKSFDLISGHIDKDFPLYIKPQFSTQLTERSKYYIVLAALERLAILAGERNEPPLEKGSVTIEQVLKRLSDDLENEEIAVLDGFGKLNQFEVDSYFFRYWYAIALKLFLESDENLTGLGYSDLQTVIHNISMNDSELFPKDKEPLKVTDKPPVISERAFKRSFDTEFQPYSLENIIYANSSLFDVRFIVLPDKSGDLFLDHIEVFGDVEVENLTDFNDEGIFTAKVRFESGEDGEKTIGITAIDNAKNTGTATLMAVKDTVKPAIDTFKIMRGDKEATGEYIALPFTIDFIVEEENFMEASLGVKAKSDTAPFEYIPFSTVRFGDKQVSKSDLPGEGEDGSYIFSVKFADKAGNIETTQFERITDTVPPVIESIEFIPPINEKGFLNTREFAVEVTASDNLEQQLNYWRRRNTGNYNHTVTDPYNVFNTTEPFDAELTYRFKVSDQAGNESPESAPFVFTIDTVFPVITISNKALLESKPWKSSADELAFNYTIEELNLDYCEVRINGVRIDEIINLPTGSFSFKNSPELDPTIGPALPNVVAIYCIDKAGNVTISEVNVYIDDEAPIATVGRCVFELGGTVPDPLIGPWLEIKPWASAGDNFGREGNVRLEFYYTATITNSLGYSQSHRFPATGYSEITLWQIATPPEGGFCHSTHPRSCRLHIPDPGDTYLRNNSYKNMELKTTNFVVHTRVSDKAGNVETASLDWITDREPAPLESAGFGYHSGTMGVSFMSAKYADNVRLSVNGTVINSACSSTYYDALKFYVHHCLFSASPGIDYNVVVSSVNSYGVSQSTDCKPLSASGEGYCFSGIVRADSPDLSVSVTGQTKTSLNYNISSNSPITVCEVLRGTSKIADCLKQVGNGTLDLTQPLYDTSGNYAIRVVARAGSGTTTERQAGFIIDNSPTSFDVEVLSYKTFYAGLLSPSFKINASIPGGVDRVVLKLKGRKIHRTRSPEVGTSFSCPVHSPFCLDTSFEHFIYEFKPVCNPMMGCAIFAYTPPPGSIPPGIYEQVSYTIYSKYPGESQSGTKLLGPQTVRIIDNDTYPKILGKSINSTTRRLEVRFVPSIISEMPLNSAAPFSYRISNNPVIKAEDEYSRICGQEGLAMTPQYNFYSPNHSKYRAVFEKVEYLGGPHHNEYVAYFKPNVDIFNAFLRKGCHSDSNCPTTAAHLSLSYSCYITTGVPNFCLVDASKHRTVPGEYYETSGGTFPCSTPMIVGSGHDHRAMYGCTLLRDFWYFRKDMKIEIEESFGIKLNTTNSATGSFTPSLTCPQLKEITTH